MDEGWIKLHRRFLEWEWLGSPEMVSLFVILLLEANHEERRWQGTIIERGQVLTSLNSLSEVSGLSIRTLRTCLSRLERTGEIVKKTTNKYTLVTISNYDRYQVLNDHDRQATDKQPTSNRQATDKRPTTNKNDKNVRMEEDIIIPDGMCPAQPSDAASETDNEVLTNRHCQNVIDFWNRTVTETNSTLPKVKTLSEERKKKMRVRWKEFKEVGDPVEVCRTVFTKVCSSKFCQGDNKSGWSADFDWVFKNAKNWSRVYEGSYDERPVVVSAQRIDGRKPDRIQNIVDEYTRFQNALYGGIDTIPGGGTPDFQSGQ